MKDYNKLLNEEIDSAHHAIIESDLMISHGITSLLDDDSVQEGVFDTIVGMAKGFGNSLKAMGMSAAKAVKAVFWDMSKEILAAAWLESLRAGMKDAEIEQDVLEYASRLKLPEAAIAVPCMWWVWTHDKGTLDRAEEIAVRYGTSADSKEVQDLVGSLDRRRESVDRHELDRLFDGWTMSGDILLEADQNDYLDKPLDTEFKSQLNQAQNTVVQDIEGDDRADEVRNWLSNINIKELAVLVLSSWTPDDTEVAHLKAAFEHSDDDESDEVKKWQMTFGSVKLVGRVRRIAAMELMLNVNKSDLTSKFPTDTISLRLRDSYAEFITRYDKWKEYASEKKADINDFDKMAVYFKKAPGGSAAGGDSLEDMRPRQAIAKILAHPSFYKAVWQNIGQELMKKSEEILKGNWGEIKKTATKVVMTATLSDFNALPGKVKTELQKVIDSDPTTKEAWAIAVKENDEEIASRVLALCRSSFTDSVLTMVEGVVKERAANVEKLKSEAEAAKAPYQSAKDPAWIDYVAMRDRLDAELVNGFKAGAPKLRSDADTAAKELKDLIAAKSAAAGGPADDETETAPESGPAET